MNKRHNNETFKENPEAAQGGADDVVDADFEEVDGDDK